MNAILISTVVACLAVIGGFAIVGYLAACAGAERWLTLREWLGEGS
jgi:hypothetical protein